ncbi:hypothetical protein [Rhizobium sp. S163]|uniref:hypothetical protein n=1 Tax=Rhizobium sp. S163 TaxID=3055039 RepID=UPI0025A93EFD|nr:hypothetical protein [Rhizobium sp. S163]
MKRKYYAAWEDPAYLASVSYTIVRFEIADAESRMAQGRFFDRDYQTARKAAWEAERSRRAMP